MYKLEVTLKQHTPLIHFQHDQEGATLRASEVKPKLDRFIIKQLTDQEKADWSTPKGTLDYKLKIESNGEKSYFDDPNLPMFFGNMSKEKKFEKKRGIIYKNIKLHFLSNDEELINKIKTFIGSFLFNHNFGTRQSKGYGSFYIDKSDSLYTSPTGNIFFYIKENDVTNTLKQVDLFYKSLRSGINIKWADKRENDRYGHPIMKDGFYFKSLIFKYTKEKLNVQWDKKTIKEKFFNDNFTYRKYNRKKNIEETFESIGLENQQKIREKCPDKPSNPLFYNSLEIALVKDLLGLSSSESWKSYNATINKTEAKFIDGYFIKIEEEKNRNISRIPSPILIKIIEENDLYRVYLLINKEINESIQDNVLGKTFIIENKDLQFDISFPDTFSYDDFLNYICSNKNFDIYSHVEKRFHSKDEFIKLKNIYNQIQKIR